MVEVGAQEMSKPPAWQGAHDQHVGLRRCGTGFAHHEVPGLCAQGFNIYEDLKDEGYGHAVYSIPTGIGDAVLPKIAR